MVVVVMMVVVVVVVVGVVLVVGRTSGVGGGGSGSSKVTGWRKLKAAIGCPWPWCVCVCVCENLADSSVGQLEGSLSRPSCRALVGGPGSEQVRGNWEGTAFGPQGDTDCLCVGRTTKGKCVCVCVCVFVPLPGISPCKVRRVGGWGRCREGVFEVRKSQ